MEKNDDGRTDFKGDLGDVFQVTARGAISYERAIALLQQQGGTGSEASVQLSELSEVEKTPLARLRRSMDPRSFKRLTTALAPRTIDSSDPAVLNELRTRLEDTMGAENLRALSVRLGL
jgi:hypothetical protein